MLILVLTFWKYAALGPQKLPEGKGPGQFWRQYCFQKVKGNEGMVEFL